ncbi:LLM class flavin-dependent oxidoreductase [Protaetiibacter intestinalis]|uniref:LLM class flavin-dependent oxidoreductase n=1 Tax=Protaetiibacter intestinalis TaxID=2419774 RepID=A0A387B6X0_9MICO|nr:LLM class flavin-dependent oxidoreductase [Protaetiibacter intestinalis]AYF98093.1 LLM class flavin-dependent oxidoreductase [Protaetiibacter intestinalis]
MPDYGHPLRFGTFLTPQAARPEAPVALARLSEELGYELATFQDHPYQPAFLDTWTLLAWVAAQTERIHVAANVHNLPLRPAPVLARAAASLDLLSGGRFELGLGAGGFVDPIVAMGGPRRTPGENVSALAEAIPLIRGLWDTDERGGLRLDGEYYRLEGAKRGPAPAHDIPILIGGLKPRMLRLIGRLGDGWLPSWAYLEEGGYPAGNAIIDEAALAAGRDPREIRRLLNIGGRFQDEGSGFLQGPPEQWVEQLLPLAAEDGVSTFIVASDDPDTLRTFAAEVAPALRERLAAERAGSGIRESSRVRGAVALAARRAGIDYEGLPETLAETAVEPGDRDYRKVRSTYMRGGSPGLVLRPRDAAEVAEAIGVARAHRELPLAIRSGSHGISGRSTNDGGLVIDVSALDAIEVLDAERRLVRIGPGARWQEVAAALEPHGWVITSGDYGGVGVGGLATAGGVGFFAREHGLTIDALRAAELVLADGTRVRVDAEHDPELFWGVRGAGANLGVVTAFEFEAAEAGEVGWAQLAFDASDTAAFLADWAAAMEASPRDVSGEIILGAPRGRMTAMALLLVDSADPDTIIERLQPFAALAPLLDQSIVLAPYAAVIANAPGDSNGGSGSPSARGGLVEHVTPELAEELERMLHSGRIHFFQIRAVGGAVADVPEEATAYAHRSANFSLVAMAGDAEWLNVQWDALEHHILGVYLSFEADARGDRVERAFPPATLARLRALKARVDPTALFRDNFPLGPRS